MIDFKPQNLGVQLDAYVSPVQIVKDINNCLDKDTKHSIAQPSTKAYMKYLAEHALGKPAKLGNLSPKDIPQNEMNSVKKDFGEIIGAVDIVAKRNLFKSLPITKQSEIFFPRRGNEPLMDYKIKEKDLEFKISAKAGKTTNTIKPKDILDLINSDDKLLKKVKDTTEYKVLTLLNQGSMVGGVLMAAGQIFQDKKCAPTKDMNLEILRMNFNEAQRIGDAKYKNTMAQFIINAEKVVVNWSRQANLKETFLTAISGKVFYLKLEKMNTTDWTPEWGTIGEFKEQDMQHLNAISFRSKNSAAIDSKGNARISDKLGLQM